MNQKQANKLMALHYRAVKAAAIAERCQPGTTTHKRAIAAYEKADTAFDIFVTSITEAGA